MNRAGSMAARVCAGLTTIVVATAACRAQSPGSADPRPSAAAAGAKPLFSEAPIGDYSGPVKVVYTAANAPKTPAPEDLQLTDTVSQYGITWKFERKVRAGRFITGDWYFVGEATVVEITPKPLYGEEVPESGQWQLINENSVKEDRYKDQWARNGSVLNQRTDTGLGGFDSRLSDHHYDPSQNAKLPIAMKPGDSLISTISAPEPIDHRGYGQPVLAAAILTCLDKPVPSDAFRPSYCDRGQKVYLARDLKRELLYTLPKPKAAPASLIQWARVFERPWPDTVNWGYASPKENMPRYGRWITCGVSHAAILLHLDYPSEDKEPLLVGFVQYGIDLWGIVRAGFPGWRGHGGFGQGRKWPIIFTGLMLGDADMQSPNANYPKCMFGEDTQTAFGKSWTGADVVFRSHPVSMKESPELMNPGEAVGTEAWRSWSSSEGYRRCCTSVEWPGQILSARLMRAEKHWNHDATFAYMDRWMTEDNVKWAIELRKALEAKGAGDKVTAWYEKAAAPTDALQLELWTKYRNNLPPAKGGPAGPERTK